MSVMFPKYFGVPHAVIRRGLWAEMKPSEQGLYIALMHESERYRSRELDRMDAKMCSLTGLSPRALRDARIKLQERGLVCCERRLGNVYRYTLCDPETGRPWPGDAKTIIRYRKKADGNQESSPAGAADFPSRQVPLTTPTAERERPPEERRPESYGLPGVFN